MGHVHLAHDGKNSQNVVEAVRHIRCSIKCGVFLNWKREYSFLKKGSVPRG